MDSVDSNLVDLDLNGLFNENQAQDENCCDTETQTIMEENVVNNIPDAENKHVPSSDEIKELQELVANLKTSSQQKKARLEAQIKEAEIENKGKELKMLALEELVTTLRQKIFYVEKSSQQEKMLLEAQIREKEMKNDEHDSKIKDLQSRVQEHVKTISYLEQISRTRSEVQTQLEIQNQEARNENAMKAMKITQLEAELQCKENVIRNLQNSKRRISAELRDKDREIDDNITRIEHLGLDLEDSRRRENELSATVSRLELEIENEQRENRDQRAMIRTCREASSCIKLALDTTLATKRVGELRARLQCREQEHLKIISDLVTNSQNEKTRLMAQIQEMENAMANYGVPLESSVDDIIDVKVDEKEIIPSKSRDNGKNTGDKWKKGLLIGGGCVAAAVALWNYGPDLSEVASALNPSRLIGNLF